MANSNIIDMVKSHCILYKGGDTNPYSGDSEMDYLKHWVWIAESSVVRGFNTAYEAWKEEHGTEIADKSERAETIYKKTISDILQRIGSPEQYKHYLDMYFDLCDK